MLKKIFMFFAIFMASVSAVCAQNSVGSYIGTLDVVKMNDKNYNAVEYQEFTVDDELNLSGKVAQIGSMPGTIYIDLDIVENGTDLTTTASTCGTLKVLNLIPITLALTDFHGTINGDNIEFTLKCNGLYKNSPIAAEVHYTGKRK